LSGVSPDRGQTGEKRWIYSILHATATCSRNGRRGGDRPAPQADDRAHQALRHIAVTSTANGAGNDFCKL
jgi:hypothetical protein